MLEHLVKPLAEASRNVYATRRHGLIDHWLDVLAAMPDVRAERLDLCDSTVGVGSADQLDSAARSVLRSNLMEFHPWRKGPFNLFGVEIDAEWRSDMKWSRVSERIGSMRGKTVLDVGCGNGYYMFRMLGAGADSVLGIDPSQLFVAQFQAIHRFCPELKLSVLPLRMEEFPLEHLEQGFDMVFSMGILYHRRDALGHLSELYRCLDQGGSLVLETLVLDGTGDEELVPEKAYAKMPNVHGVPTPARLVRYLDEAGFRDIELLDITPTLPAEQRATEWMTFESLSDFLDPENPGLTVEGHPAPVRAVVAAKK